ncbi:type VII secretion target [Rhodococcus tibetensis]|uniref:Type VII secretion target n=1 Tax=Rhodococcus tibetensis TaxID=2965064 RepID=A0ABT1QD77_9NOCA|nr:type VII secretion target [Rhodococcus sp. FXJ9.536]MCQ4120234.1 type VII secretion target [Rhodococcus sp. FXJ9.536]
MSDGLEVDVTVVASAGARMVRSAEVLRQRAVDAEWLEFGGAQAGREYRALGDELRDALGVVSVALDGWATDTEAFGNTLRSAATRYAGTDGTFADALDEVRP